MLFYLFSHEFGWSPSKIRRLFIDEAVAYLEQIGMYRKTCPAPDQSLAIIKEALLAFLGVETKRVDTPEIVEEKIKKMGAVTVTKQELAAWEKAGMPSPFSGWLKNYRKKK